jgi:hypothetical protein
VLWTICNSCGAKWADDEGGMPEWQDPPEWEQARAALAAYEAECSNHPDAPHGFDRNASHNEGRYVCECESWSPPAAPAAPSYLTRDTVVSGVRVIKVWPVGSYEPQILGTTIGAAPAAPAPAGFVLSPVDIYDFAGWLTTRPGKMEVGSSCEAGPMAEAVGEYLRTYPERFQAAPAAPADGWQPIDTAPKDGDVLIYVTETDEQFVAYWDDCWRFAPNAKLKTPTHWMPLPAAPEASKKGGAA